jgi:hypothetical protein
MNQEIWKFSTIDKGFADRFEIKMPKNTQLLYVDIDAHNFPCIWGLVYPHEETEIRYFELFGTGHTIPNDMGVERKYVGSYRYQNGEFIGHIFERIN